MKLYSDGYLWPNRPNAGISPKGKLIIENNREEIYYIIAFCCGFVLGGLIMSWFWGKL